MENELLAFVVKQVIEAMELRHVQGPKNNSSEKVIQNQKNRQS
jgi:hypothetical protein